MQPTVWLLVYGDAYDMGVDDIKGVYAAPELAREPFDAYAALLEHDDRGLPGEPARRTMSDAEVLGDGGLCLRGRSSDRVALVPSPFTGPQPGAAGQP